MTAVIISLFTLGMIDMLDPYGITTLLILLQMVRKDWHVLVKVWSSYLTYWLAAVGVYFGVSAYLLRFFEQLPKAHPLPTGIIALVLGSLSLAGAVILSIRLWRNWATMDQDISKIIYIKSVHPVFLFFFGVFSVLSNLPACWPLFSYIAVLLPARQDPLTIVLLLGIFTLFSKIPQLVVYALYRRLEARRFERFMAVLRRWLTRLMLVAIPLVLLGIGLWSLGESWRRLHHYLNFIP